MINRISLTALCFFMFVSCTLKPPQFTVTGIQKNEAVSFLEKFQKEEKTSEQFSHYVESLRTRSIPGFAWHDYWSEVEEKKLYDNLKPEELDQLLALSEMSCHPKSQDSFARLLLQIAKSDAEKLLFSRYLVFLNCTSDVSDDVFRSIVLFLSQKRAESELANLVQVKSQKDFAMPEESKPAKLEESELAKLVQVKSQKDFVMPVVKQNGRYPYTEELSTLLLTEWSGNRHNRNWPEVLSALDSNWYSDVRYINHTKKDWNTIKKILEMEWDIRKFINHLDQDIFWMFEKTNKMADIIRLGGYDAYFSKSVNWSSLWKKLLQDYPVKPNNSNVDTLLAFYSCEKMDLPSYSALVVGWDLSERSFKNCPNIIKQFKQKEWNNLVHQVRSKNLLQEAQYADATGSVTDDATGSVTNDTGGAANGLDQLKALWQAGAILSEQKDTAFINSSIKMLSAKEWEVFIFNMMMSLTEPKFENRYEVFWHIVDQVRSVYPFVPGQAVCLMFSLKNSHFLIQKFRPEWALDMFGLVDWSYLKKQKGLAGIKKTTTKNICFNKVSRQKINTLLFVLSYTLLDPMTPLSAGSDSDYIQQVSHKAKDIMSLTQQVRAFDHNRSTTFYYDYHKFFSTAPFLWRGALYGYDISVEPGLMKDTAFPFWFSSLVFTKLKAVAGTVQDMQNILQKYIKEKKSEPSFVLNTAHISWMEYFLERVDWDSDNFGWGGPKKKSHLQESGNKLAHEKKWEWFKNSGLLLPSSGRDK